MTSYRIRDAAASRFFGRLARWRTLNPDLAAVLDVLAFLAVRPWRIPRAVLTAWRYVHLLS